MTETTTVNDIESRLGGKTKEDGCASGLKNTALRKTGRVRIHCQVLRMKLDHACEDVKLCCSREKNSR